MYPDNSSLIVKFFTLSLPLFEFDANKDIKDLQQQLEPFAKQIKQLKQANVFNTLTSEQQQYLLLEQEILELLQASIDLKFEKRTDLPTIDTEHSHTVIKTFKHYLIFFREVMLLPLTQNSTNNKQTQAMLNSGLNIVTMAYQQQPDHKTTPCAAITTDWMIQLKKGLQVLHSDNQAINQIENWCESCANLFIKKMAALRHQTQIENNKKETILNSNTKLNSQIRELTIQSQRDNILKINALLSRVFTHKQRQLRVEIDEYRKYYQQWVNQFIKEFSNQCNQTMEMAIQQAGVIENKLSLLANFFDKIDGKATQALATKCLILRAGAINKLYEKYITHKVIDIKSSSNILSIQAGKLVIDLFEKLKFDFDLISKTTSYDLSPAALYIDALSSLLNNKHDKLYPNLDHFQFENIVDYESTKIMSAQWYAYFKNHTEQATAENRIQCLNTLIQQLIKLITQATSKLDQFDKNQQTIMLRVMLDYLCSFTLLCQNKNEFEHYKILTKNLADKLSQKYKMYTGYHLILSTHQIDQTKECQTLLRTAHEECLQDMRYLPIITSGISHLFNQAYASQTYNPSRQKLVASVNARLSSTLKLFQSGNFVHIQAKPNNDQNTELTTTMDKLTYVSRTFIACEIYNKLANNRLENTINEVKLSCTVDIQDILIGLYKNDESNKYLLCLLLVNVLPEIEFEINESYIDSFPDDNPVVNLAYIVSNYPLPQYLIDTLALRYQNFIKNAYNRAEPKEKETIIDNSIKQITQLIKLLSHISSEKKQVLQYFILDLYMILITSINNEAELQVVMNSKCSKVLDPIIRKSSNPSIYHVIIDVKKHSLQKPSTLNTETLTTIGNACDMLIENTFLHSQTTITKFCDAVNESMKKIKADRKSLSTLSKPKKQLVEIAEKYLEPIKKIISNQKKTVNQNLSKKRINTFSINKTSNKKKKTSNTKTAAKLLLFSQHSKTHTPYINEAFEKIYEFHDKDAKLTRDYYKKYIENRVTLNRLYALDGLIHCYDKLSDNKRLKLKYFIEQRASSIFDQADGDVFPEVINTFKQHYFQWAMSQAVNKNPAKTTKPVSALAKPLQSQDNKPKKLNQSFKTTSYSRKAPNNIHTPIETNKISVAAKQQKQQRQPFEDIMLKNVKLNLALTKREQQVKQFLVKNHLHCVIQGATPLDNLLGISANDLDLVVFTDEKTFKKLLKDNKENLGIYSIRKNKNTPVYVLDLKSLDKDNVVEQIEICCLPFKGIDELDNQLRELARGYGISIIYGDASTNCILDPLKHYQNLISDKTFKVVQAVGFDYQQYFTDNPERLLQMVYKQARYQANNTIFTTGHVLDKEIHQVIPKLSTKDFTRQFYQSLFDKLFLKGYANNAAMYLQQYKLLWLIAPTITTDKHRQNALIEKLKNIDQQVNQHKPLTRTTADQLRADILDHLLFPTFKDKLSFYNNISVDDFYEYCAKYLDSFYFEIDWPTQNLLQTRWLEQYINDTQPKTTPMARN